MIMNEHDNNQYTKGVNEVEAYLLRIIKRYFELNNIYTEASIESMIVESLTRLKRILKDKEHDFVFAFNDMTGNITLSIKDFNGEPAIDKRTAFNKDFGETQDTVCEGDDPRLYDAREPLSHAHIITNVENLREELDKFKLGLDSTHLHDNQDVLDILTYTGIQTQIDLIILENILANMPIYTQKLNLIKSDITNFHSRQKSNINGTFDNINENLILFRQIINSAGSWLEQFKKDCNATFEELKNDTANVINTYFKKADLETLYKDLDNTYYLYKTDEVEFGEDEITYTFIESELSRKPALPSYTVTYDNNKRLASNGKEVGHLVLDRSNMKDIDLIQISCASQNSQYITITKNTDVNYTLTFSKHGTFVILITAINPLNTEDPVTKSTTFSVNITKSDGTITDSGSFRGTSFDSGWSDYVDGCSVISWKMFLQVQQGHSSSDDNRIIYGKKHDGTQVTLFSWTGDLSSVPWDDSGTCSLDDQIAQIRFTAYSSHVSCVTTAKINYSFETTYDPRLVEDESAPDSGSGENEEIELEGHTTFKTNLLQQITLPDILESDIVKLYIKHADGTKTKLPCIFPINDGFGAIQASIKNNTITVSSNCVATISGYIQDKNFYDKYTVYFANSYTRNTYVNLEPVLTRQRVQLAIAESKNKIHFLKSIIYNANAYYLINAFKSVIYDPDTDTVNNIWMTKGDPSITLPYTTPWFCNNIEYGNIAAIGKYLVTSETDTYVSNDYVYKVYNNQLTWFQAKEFCENLGCTLAMPKTQSEVDFIVSIANKYNVNGLWLGATDAETEGVWKWLDGELMTYNNWNTGEPNNSGGENHLETYAISQGGKWNDLDGSKHNLGFIGQWENGGLYVKDMYGDKCGYIGYYQVPSIHTFYPGAKLYYEIYRKGENM